MDNLKYEIFKLVLTSDTEKVEKAIGTTKKVLEFLFDSENTKTAIPEKAGFQVFSLSGTPTPSTPDRIPLEWVNRKHGEEF